MSIGFRWFILISRFLCVNLCVSHKRTRYDDGKRRKLAIDSFDNYLPFETVLKKDVARGYHVTFIVPKMDAFEEYEEMIITFIPFSGKERTIVLKAKDRKKDLMLFDDSIWEIE